MALKNILKHFIDDVPMDDMTQLKFTLELNAIDEYLDDWMKENKEILEIEEERDRKENEASRVSLITIDHKLNDYLNSWLENRIEDIKKIVTEEVKKEILVEKVEPVFKAVLKAKEDLKSVVDIMKFEE